MSVGPSTIQSFTNPSDCSSQHIDNMSNGYNPYTRKPPLSSSPIDPFYGFIPRRAKTVDVVRLMVRANQLQSLQVVDTKHIRKGRRHEPFHQAAFDGSIQKDLGSAQETAGVRADRWIL